MSRIFKILKHKVQMLLLQRRDDYCLISQLNDNNIFHFFTFEIMKIWCLILENKRLKFKYIVLEHLNLNIKSHIWRHHLINSIGLKVISMEEANDLKIRKFIKVEKHNWGFNSFKFIDYTIDTRIEKFSEKVINNNQIHQDENYILYIKRRENRTLFDSHTKLPFEELLESFCDQKKLKLKVAFFEDISPKNQIQLCLNASTIISVHGAANTNLIFAQRSCTFIEINFRKYWQCDPVCDKHFYGQISYTDRCEGKLLTKKEFHKADYYNLSRLKGIQYVEIEIENAEIFNSRNPIDLNKIYINSDNLLKLLN